MSEGDASDRGRVALVVDSDETTRRFAARALSAFIPGFHVATARDGREATDWLDSSFPDLLCISTDDSSNSELLLQLRNDPRGRRCRIILIGSASSESTSLAISDFEVSAILTKPLRLSSFLARVRDVAGVA